MTRHALALLLVLGASATARADDGEGWQTVSTGTITIKARARAGSSIREIQAEGDIDAPGPLVAQAIYDADRFTKFMPYTKEARFVTDPDDAGARITYVRIDVPVVSDRDYFISARVVQDFAPDGGGSFANEWTSVSSRYPSRRGIVRMTTNTGSWHITALGPMKCHAVYQFTVDPGGSLPQWAADWSNRTGVPDVFKAVQKEALRLEAERAQAAKEGKGAR